jgi:Sulfotransferase family
MSNNLEVPSLPEHTTTEVVKETAMSLGNPKSTHVPPIFVVGVWRSGTTLLYSLLNQHPDIRLFYESDLPALWPMFRLPWSRKMWFEKWEYWNAGVSRHDLVPSDLETPVHSLAEAAELAGRQYAAQKGKTRWGCKSPSYYDRLVFLAREFPQAKFIVIWRDPEDVCRSVINAAKTALWFTRPGMTHKALLASKVLKKQYDSLVSMGASVHQIHYEDLVRDPKTTMQGICKFLEVPFTPEVAVLHKDDRSAVFSGAHHNLAKGTRIVAKRDRKEPLPEGLANKVRKYKALWKTQEGDRWMLTQRFSEDPQTKIGSGERAKDQAKFMLLRLWDIAPRICFSILPLAVWQTYRRLKYKDAQWVHRQITTKETTLRGH